MRILALTLLAPLLGALGLLGASGGDEVELLRRISELDSPALLVLFIVLLAKGKLRWERDVKRAEAETAAWKEVALGGAEQAERHVTVAEAAIEAARRSPRGGA